MPNKKYRIYALDSITYVLEQKLYDPLWTDIFGFEGTKDDVRLLKEEIEKVIKNMWEELNKLKYNLPNTSFQVWPVVCEECGIVLDFHNHYITSGEEYIQKSINDGNAYIEGAFYCPSCITEKIKESTGLIGEDNPLLAHKLWSVTCSNLKCTKNYVLAEFEREEDAIERAKREGYRNVKDKWYCSDCCINRKTVRS